MHTAICSFEHRDAAERARDRLLQAGFDRRDVHLQHRGPTDSDAMGEDPRAWEGTDREIAASRDMVDRVAGFFVHLFGAGREEGDRDAYRAAVERGHTVVVVDTRDEAEARRAREVLHELQAADVNVYHQPDRRPLREIVDVEGEGGGLAGSYQDRSSAFDAAAQDRGERGSLESDRERAMAAVDAVAPAAGRDWTSGPDAALDRDRSQASREGEDTDRVGLRYADKDKPGR